MRKLPDVSHLQVLVLECLGARKTRGRDLRHQLSEHGQKKSGSSFYQLMARMEDSGFVRGEYSQKIVEGQIIKERSYQITALGETALRETNEFYEGISFSRPIGGLAHA